ncbi:YggT family protein [Collinsella tanakaei]|uniref:YggT family protein n=1 Tax=Collinsella tanakaei TaxID=626935 RepID=UPI00315C8974
MSTLVQFYELLIVIYCLLTWFPMRQGGLLHDFAAVLDSICGPYLSVFRRIIPPLGGIDFSPVVALLALSLGERLLFNILL